MVLRAVLLFFLVMPSLSIASDVPPRYETPYHAMEEPPAYYSLYNQFWCIIHPLKKATAAIMRPLTKLHTNLCNQLNARRARDEQEFMREQQMQEQFLQRFAAANALIQRRCAMLFIPETRIIGH